MKEKKEESEGESEGEEKKEKSEKEEKKVVEWKMVDHSRDITIPDNKVRTYLSK